jgi:hypothetical protein
MSTAVACVLACRWGGLRAVAQLGSASDWGSEGRRFKSCQPDRVVSRDIGDTRTCGCRSGCCSFAGASGGGEPDPTHPHGRWTNPSARAHPEMPDGAGSLVRRVAAMGGLHSPASGEAEPPTAPARRGPAGGAAAPARRPGALGGCRTTTGVSRHVVVLLDAAALGPCAAVLLSTPRAERRREQVKLSEPSPRPPIAPGVSMGPRSSAAPSAGPLGTQDAVNPPNGSALSHRSVLTLEGLDVG